VVERQVDLKKEKETKEARKEKKEVVFVMNQGKALMKPVVTGISSTSDIEITSGLKEGDTVISGPYRTLKNLKDGDKVRIKKEEEEKEKEEKEDIWE